jgi:enediyne biosynthesis protein E7
MRGVLTVAGDVEGLLSQHRAQRPPEELVRRAIHRDGFPPPPAARFVLLSDRSRMSAAPELKVPGFITKALKLVDADRLRWLDEAATAGPVVALRIGPVRNWIVTDPDAAKAILVTDGSTWTRPPATLAPIRMGVGENLFTQSDKAWAQVQPLVAPAFRKKALEQRLADIDALIDDEVGQIPRDTTIDLEVAMGRMALRLAAWVLLGEQLDPTRAEEIAHHQREVIRWVGAQLGKVTGSLPIALGARGQEMKRHRAVLNAYADEVITRAKASDHPDEDVLGALLSARPSGNALAPGQLRSHVLGLFLAGNETTAAALSWALVHGARTPDAWVKVRDDPDRHTAPFLTETLRLTPAVWGIPRTPARAGVTLTAGTVTTRVRRGQLATVYLRGINRDPNRWPDPLRFDPSRHHAGSSEAHRALLPFGLGPRGCIGQHLAMAELIAVLPALARRGDITIDGTIIEDPSFALRIHGGLKGRFTTRQVPEARPPTPTPAPASG